MVADRDDAPPLDRQGLEQPADVAGIGPAVVAQDHREQAVHADDPPAQAARRIDGPPGRGVRDSCRFASGLVALSDVLDDRAVPRQLPLGPNAIDGRLRGGSQLVVAELSGQVVGPRPILAVLSESDPDFLFLHDATRLHGGRLSVPRPAAAGTRHQPVL